VVTDTVGGTIGGAVGAPVGHVLGKTLGNGTINIGGGMSVATVGGPSLPVGAITVSAGTVGGAVSVGSVVITSRSGAHLTNVFMAAKRMSDEEAREVDAPNGFTRIAIARELGITEVPVKIRLPSDPLPDSMLGRFGDARTWGEALRFRTGNQRPPLPPTGTPNVPRLPN
jgi:hypothetical protein